MSRREIASRLLGNQFTSRIWSLASARSEGLRILAYHRVIDDDPATFPFDEELISADTESFYNQMKFARNNFDVISFQDLRQSEIEGRKLPHRALLITFDDGYKDNYTNAFPVLKALALPATIFLTTGCINQSKLFWWDRITYSLKKTRRAEISFPSVSGEPMSLRSAIDRRSAIERVLEWIKEVPEEVRQGFLERLNLELDVEMPEHLARKMMLTWEEINLMASEGIEFGSHTITHPILANVGHAQLEQEIFESKRAIERHLGKEAIAFAYPAGTLSRFSLEAKEAVARAGFHYAVSYEDSMAFYDEFDRFALPRIHVERDHSIERFRANLMFPQLMFKRGRKPRQWPMDSRQYAVGSRQ